MLVVCIFAESAKILQSFCIYIFYICIPLSPNIKRFIKNFSIKMKNKLKMPLIKFADSAIIQILCMLFKKSSGNLKPPPLTYTKKAYWKKYSNMIHK